MMTSRHLFCATALLLASQPLVAAEGGIGLGQTRVIFSAADKAQSITVTNSDSRAWLVQSRVQMGVNDNSPAPFIVTPPLARLEANGELVLRIRRNDVALPEDRESVFFISMKALPVQQSAPEQMVMTVVSNMKLFYRPEGLAKRAMADMAPKLKFRREGQQVRAINPTPYWLTFSRLQVGNAALDKTALRHMVPPFGEQTYTLPSTAAGKISWQLIDEDGWDTPWSLQD